MDLFDPAHQSTSSSPTLTAHEINELTIYKHWYTVQESGLTHQETRRLLFARWLVRTGRLSN